MKNKIVIILIILSLVGMQPVAHAAPVECDETLFFAGQVTALRDPTPPPFNFEQMHWQFVDGQYQVDYWWKSGFSGFVQTVNVRQGKRLVGVATNGEWSVCHSSRAWRKYLTAHLP